MKSLTIVTFIFLLIFGCDAPVQDRIPVTDIVDTSGTTSSASGESSDYNDKLSDLDEAEGGDVIDPDAPEVRNGFEHCELGYAKYGGVSLGYFDICQNRDDQKKFKFHFQDASTFQKVCFIPTSISGSGTNRMGIPLCMFVEAREEVGIFLKQTIVGQVNGIMILKEADGYALESFIDCTDSFANIVYSNPGCSTNYTCLTNAKAIQASKCSAFKAKYSDFYRQVQFF